ncbi:hypothetical protein BDM02DRAFT_3121778 [Thelephora ganbajun]|uniref:Uncharacterized protein n=1 Tax=Thelephora ganbajun TaxID=370292 RepID=A0ACB6Z468_THEGA|nr:hypothetical protein BDM02DRAFT_3121778 [Thelephora ganbajun]
MHLANIALSILLYIGRVVAVAPVVARQETTTFLFGQSSTPGAPPTTFDWWPFGDLWTGLVPQPSLTSSGLSRLPTATSFTSSSPLPHTSASLSPSIIDITALPPATTNIPRPQARTRQNFKPFSLAPVFVIAGLLLGALVGWLTFSSYVRWLAKSTAVALLPGPAYVPVKRTNERADAEAGNVEGSPSKHTRHGTPYSSYSVGRGLLGRIPSSGLYKPLPSISREKTKTINSEKSFVWPSLPDSSRPTPSHSRAATNTSTKSMQIVTVTLDDPFASTENNSTGTDTKSQTLVVASRTSTRSTFAHASRFGEMWSDEEEDQDTVFVSSLSPTHPAEGEVKTGFLKRIRSKSKSTGGKKRDEEPTSGTGESASPVKATSSRKGSWNFPWIPGSPSVKPDTYTAAPVRTSSPRSQSFRTPESSPRKPSFVRSGEKVRLVDTSVLPASPPTLTSPRLESEFFLNTMVIDVPGTPTPKRTKSSRAVTGLGRDEERDDTDALDPTSPLFRQSCESERSSEIRPLTKHDSRPGLRRLPTTPVSAISEFLGDPPPKRTPAERFYARHSALDRVEEIIQRSRSQASVANAGMSPGGSTLDTVGEERQSSRAGGKFGSGGIEQRLFRP